MTASDFHRILRNKYTHSPNDTKHLHLDDVAHELNLSRKLLQTYLHTLETLGLVEYHDDRNEIFSLTESGKLANLP